VETTCKPFQEGIHYPAETFQKAIHYLLANSKGRWIAACNKLSLHAAIHHLSPFSEMSPLHFENEQKPINKQLTINKQHIN
jgi:hypothetical protein